jgi:hypothetical protein
LSNKDEINNYSTFFGELLLVLSREKGAGGERRIVIFKAGMGEEIIMKERWVKKEEVEKQLDEIFQLMLEIDDKMEKVIHNIVVHHCETNEASIKDLEKRVEKIESYLDVEASGRVDIFHKTLSFSALSS